MASSAPAEIPENPQIPIDLTVTKSIPGLTSGSKLTFHDALGNIVYRVDARSSPEHQKVIVDALQKPLISIVHHKGAGWQGFRGDSCDWKDLIFRVERTFLSRLRTVLEAFLVGQNWEDAQSDFRVQGSPFHRSCTIYRGNSIVAQTSAMYKLGKAVVGRHKFRLTIYPGADHVLVVALLVIFFGGS